MNLKFYSDPKLKVKNVRPLVRLSLVCLQSCMTASRDGIATFMVDYDLTKATSKDMAKDADAVEDMIGHAFKLAECLDKEFMTRFVQPIGNLLMRCALKLVGKEKQAFDGIKRTMDELKALYLTDMSKIVGSKVECDNWPADVHVQANIDESSQPSGANQKRLITSKPLETSALLKARLNSMVSDWVTLSPKRALIQVIHVHFTQSLASPAMPSTSKKHLIIAVRLCCSASAFHLKRSLQGGL